jgi:putative transposase
MSKKSNYISTNRSKHYLKCHLIFVCKYRKKLLVGQLKEDMRSILLNITSNSDFEIEVFESDLDHIHFLIRYIPRLSITSIVRKLKQESTYHIWRSSHRPFLFKHFWKEHTFWSDGYFVCSIGEASPDTIREYILNQG